MTNFEKYKKELVKLLLERAIACSEIYRLRTGDKNCPAYNRDSGWEVCEECERLNEEWLEKEYAVQEPSQLKAGDKIRMRKLEEKSAWMYEVVCNSFPALWLRFRASENKVPQAKDENFLISYDDFLDKYEIYEVFNKLRER